MSAKPTEGEEVSSAALPPPAFGLLPPGGRIWVYGAGVRLRRTQERPLRHAAAPRATSPASGAGGLRLPPHP
ncbi:hypothetical protein CA606_00580 [Caulobacter vibrioides]|uniref:Uncharacterized protein n=1 Tax=Caulobacter vibrioides TaxID=155892 RepID=A0A290MUP0_CAUVI|nr:hypothetical protein CA606_00580 [Caulobacter vibrioides]